MTFDVPSLAAGGGIGGFAGGLFFSVHYAPPLVAVGTAVITGFAGAILLVVVGQAANAVGKWSG